MDKDEFAHIEDKELLNKYSSEGDSQWLGILLQRYTLLLFGVCMKYLKNEDDARDSVQQIFLKAIMEVRKYKIDYFKSWLYMVAKNHCLMRIRDRQGKIPVELKDDVTTDRPNVEQKEELAEKEVTMQYIEEGLQHLNPEQRQCVTLFYLQKRSYQQICDTTGYSLLQVKSFIQNGKRNLKLFVEKKLKTVHG